MTFRPRLNEDEWNLIQEYRNGKTNTGNESFKHKGNSAEYSFETDNRIESLEDLIKHCNIDLNTWDIERWVCNKWEVGAKDIVGEVKVTPLFQVKVWLKPKVVDIKEVFKQIISDAKNHIPKYPKYQYPEIIDGHLLVIDPADVHIGKLCRAFEAGEEYNSQVAVQRVKEGVQGILTKAQGFNIDKILYVIGNDKLHVDTPRNTTTSGTYQDSHLMWYDAFKIALQLDREIIEMLMQIAPVHVQFDPSNHDYQTGFFLAQTLEAWFSKCEGVTFNVSIAHRKYFKYGKNLIGTTHGDGAKVQDLPLLMAQEAAEYWAECVHRYIYMHHIHHKMSKDFGSVCLEALRSPSGTDSWHHRNGYQHAPKAIEGFIHHKDHGQIARFTHIF